MKRIYRITTLACAALLYGCGGGIDNPRSSAALDSATTHGRADAAIVADSTASIMERERAILNIRHKEAHMRAMGYEEAADAYIEGAESVIPDSILRP